MFQDEVKAMSKIVLLLLLILSVGKVGAQNVESVSFDSQYGEYVIRYINEDGKEQTAYYVPGDQAMPEISATVKFDSTDNIFNYAYRVQNRNEAKVGLYSFSVEVNDAVVNTNNPNNSWVTGMYDSLSAYDWADRGGRREVGIQPGESETFFFQSKGLPSIVNDLANPLAFKLSCI